MAVLEAALGTWDAGGWNNYAYPLFLIGGFLAAADRRLGTAIARYGTRALVLAVALLPVLFVIAHFDLGGAGHDLGRDYGPWSVAWRLLKATTGCALTAAIFGLAPALLKVVARRWGSLVVAADGSAVSSADGRAGRLTRVSRYMQEAVLPFYVLHQTPVVIIGFYVVQWRAELLGKYLMISLTSLLATLAFYDLAVRRTRITRMLFGMRPGGG